MQDWLFTVVFPKRVTFFLKFLSFLFSFFGHMACGILIPQTGTESMLPAVEAHSLKCLDCQEVSKEGNFLTEVFQPKIQL